MVGINGVNKKIVRMSSKKNKNNYIKNNKENENKKYGTVQYVTCIISLGQRFLRLDTGCE
jgi:hypothetical protein